ncbi:hypothetical protein JCM10908_003247 [Rhodotorula pacifica]|uniref:uncharacterized protein n=1 Tax=Rhodotorula pacifica TaxID=1495444 RepID=UPI003174D9E4
MSCPPRSAPPSHRRRRRRMPALIASAASVLLASGLAVSLAVGMRSFERELDNDLDSVDMDQTAVAIWWAGDVALRWAFISAAGSVCGVLGLVLRKSKLHGIFALTTAFDLLATIFLTLTLLLLTFSPSLSEPFGEFICSSSYASDFSGAARSLLARPSEHSTLSWTNGIELAFWGVETCEDAWQSAMLRILVGCAITIGLRMYGTWVTWDANVDLRESELRDRGLGWETTTEPLLQTAEGLQADEDDDDVQDSKSILEKAVRRLSSSGARPAARYTPLEMEEARPSRSVERRSRTLPSSSHLDEKQRRTRSRTSSGSSSPSSRRNSSEPRLILVPFVIDSQGHAVYEPCSPTLRVPPCQPSALAARRASTLSTRLSPPRPRTRTSTSSSDSQCPSLSASSAPSSPTSPVTPCSTRVLFDEPDRIQSTSPARCQSSSTKSVDETPNRTRWSLQLHDDVQV